MKTIEEEFPPEREIFYSWELEEKYEALRARAVEMERALLMAAALPTHQDCPVENHAIVVAAMEALATRP